ncbi:nucleobase:cation symporter-2 family protein [Macrococcoides caseolyticum]|uniref:nucleobase:cation symporter-2 family protein n=1 Tax=Macrococcoides caseolyticum TaxID=69966 RepID=UPI000C326054|nr:nucleobase:cation symporter-2 family protein [Macrococcus caseolyticus]MDJ1089464.1 nucleobase:cation symporter-2 family protein [Macrococcus caseolyticus]MDJ1091331.1 nucleobase:cation symporter-2 family protein [Macrococcus caseolyticus]MDJ1153601.1 nucleobase:cation symporter-2 family protein [Macrococcus caseolyticus]MDJ1156188.1 nucleobase:cation symporter-2 family protein [Macrococcus caseolyticus]PKE10726.1 xanthine permease [Macrococcus caseolyticus]
MKNLLLSLQHLLAMYAGAIIVPIIVGHALDFTAQETAYLVSVDIFMCGIATFLQVYKGIGIGLPVVLGCTFTAVTPMIMVGSKHGIDVLYGSLFASGIIIVLISPFFSYLVKIFPPVVTGSVVTIIGITLMPVAMNNLAGGQGNKDYGAPINILLGLITLIIILIIHRLSSGFIRSIAILLGLVIGTIIASFFGLVNIGAVHESNWFELPKPFRFAGFKFEIGSILLFVIVGIVSLIESTGVYSALSEITNTKIERKDISKGYRAEGIAIVLGSIFNAFPYTAYSQNVGLVSLSGVKSNKVMYGMIALLLLCGSIPKLGAIATIIPTSVLGGAMIAMFGMVMAYGVKMLGAIDFTRQDNLLIIAVSVGIGLGITTVPEAFSKFGSDYEWLTQNGIVIGTFTAIILNLFFNGLNDKQMHQNMK